MALNVCIEVNAFLLPGLFSSSEELTRLGFKQDEGLCTQMDCTRHSSKNLPKALLHVHNVNTKFTY